MALTGLFLCLFIVVHVSGNLQLFKNDGGKAFNEYTVFMTTFVPVKIISYINYAMFLLHAVNGLYLATRNQKARPVKYKSNKDNRLTTWASRNMALLGTVILFFLVIHMGNFWYKFHWGDIPVARYEYNPAKNLNKGTVWMPGSTEAKVYDYSVNPIIKTTTTIPSYEFKEPLHYYEGETEVTFVKDLYSVVEESFKLPWYSALYVISMIALAYHLIHGFQSSFQTLGIRYPKYNKLIRGLGTAVFGIIIPALFAAMPVYFLFFK